MIKLASSKLFVIVMIKKKVKSCPWAFASILDLKVSYQYAWNIYFGTSSANHSNSFFYTCSRKEYECKAVSRTFKTHMGTVLNHSTQLESVKGRMLWSYCCMRDYQPKNLGLQCLLCNWFFPTFHIRLRS